MYNADTLHIHVTINSLQVHSWLEIIKLQKFQTLHCSWYMYMYVHTYCMLQYAILSTNVHTVCYCLQVYNCIILYAAICYCLEM